MFRFMLLTAMMFAITLTVVCAEATLPPAAVTAMDKLEKSESKLTADYKKALIQQRTKTIGELEKVMKDVTKTGDLELALAVKAKINDLNIKNAAEVDTDLLGLKKEISLDPAKLIIGMWNYQKTNTFAGTIEFMPSGNFSATVTAPLNYPYVPGKWEIKGEQVVLTWLGDATKVDALRFTAADKLIGDTHDLGKDSITINKPPAK